MTISSSSASVTLTGAAAAGLTAAVAAAAAAEPGGGPARVVQTRAGKVMLFSRAYLTSPASTARRSDASTLPTRLRKGLLTVVLTREREVERIED